ncbi:MAG: glutamate--tRNA ligase [Candidatus Saccharimonadales bacterium]
MSEIRTRFPPSPTGFLHIGGIRTALYNYLLAKKHGGQFVLRLEDTDRERFVAAGVSQIVAGLDWIGLKPDEGFWISQGTHQGVEYIQSERHLTGLYQKFADQLVNQGLAYYSPTSPEELASMREQAQKAKRPFLYRRQGQDGQAAAKNTPIRLDIEAVQAKLAIKIINWKDEIRGDFSEEARHMEDFIIIKSDGYPTYNFANVIDDHDMNISHVVRGDEFLSSTAKHALLYDIFGWQRPVFIHLPVINGQDGKKLSKRSGDTNVLDYRDKGYLPAAVINFLALLGWNDGTEQEIYSLAELIEKFDISGINRSPAVFDQKKLDWINGLYIRQLTIADLEKLAENFWPPAAKSASPEYRRQILALLQERLKYLAEIAELTGFFFEEPKLDQSLINNHKQLKKMSQAELKTLLQQSLDAIKESDFSVADLQSKLNELIQATGQKPAILFSLIRIATTQAPASPGLAETMAVLGKETSLKRIQTQLDALQ